MSRMKVRDRLSLRRESQRVARLIRRSVAADHNYTTLAEAPADAAFEAFEAVASPLGITGFQGSWAALSLYTRLLHIKCPVMVLRAEDALYPQYDLYGRVAEWLQSEDMVQWLGEQAAERLASDHGVPHVRDHWQMLVDNASSVAS